MPQIVKKRRSGWAILAAGAMVASLLAVGASPAAAVPIDANSAAGALSLRTACLGPALDDADFNDVSSATHGDNINCIAYYEITTGREGGTQFAPRADVTRSQMSLFLSRMADKTGVDLDDAVGAGFNDLDGIGADRVDAINRLVNAGIMTGRTETTFDPLSSVSRAEMALWLVNFMAVSTGDTSPVNVTQEKAGTYLLELNVAGTTSEVAEEYFSDSRATQPRHVDSAIGVAFEMGITTGYSDLTFKPNRLVSREEMATFIARTLAHTNLRPADLTSQASGNPDEGYDIQVSIRDADFVPVPNKPVDLFGTAYPDDAFDGDGVCVRRFVIELQPSFTPCEIDAGDQVTDDDGNAEFDTLLAGPDPEETTVECGTVLADNGVYPAGDAVGSDSDDTTWAWNGDLKDEVDEDTDLFETVLVSPFRRQAKPKPHHAEISGGLDSKKNQQEARFGQVVNYTVQLHALPKKPYLGPMGGHIAATPDSSGNKYTVVVTRNFLAYVNVLGDHDDNDQTPNVVTGRDRVDGDMDGSPDTGILISVTPSVLAPDENGTLVIPITHPDADTSKNNDDIRVSIRILPFGSDPNADDYNGARGGVVDADGDDLTTDDQVTTTAFEHGDDYIAAVEGVVMFTDDIVFSDDNGDPSRFLIAADSVDYRVAPGPTGSANNYVNITVLDQYGRPVRGFPVNAVSDRNNSPANEGTSTLPFVQYFTTRSNGSYAVNYSYSGSPSTETLQVFGHEDRPNRDTDENTDGLEQPSGDTAIDAALEASGTPLREGVGAAAPTNANNATVYWSGVGRAISSPDDGYAGAAILVVDVENQTFVVEQIADGAAANPTGPHMYSWDSVDTFTVGSTPVSMELFQEILEASMDDDSKIGVTINSVSWTSYNYTRPVDRANWVVQATCTGGPNDP